MFLSTIAVEFFIFPVAIKDFFLAFAIDFQKVGINQIDKEEHRKLSGYSLDIGGLAVGGYKNSLCIGLAIFIGNTCKEYSLCPHLLGI